MTLLEALTVANSKISSRLGTWKVYFAKYRLNKRGSMYIEASMTLPLACFILIALVGLTMTFHGNVARQAENHKETVAGWDCKKEMELIRRYDRFIDWI